MQANSDGNRTAERLARFTLACVLAAPLLSHAQQQRPSSRAGWPCGARLDPSYFRVAEGTGGHLLLLSPEEISDSAALLTAFGNHPQTIFRLAGSIMPGIHEFQVPIDSFVESALFSISVQCLQIAEVVRPSGAAVLAGDEVTDLAAFRAQRMVVVKRPEPGIWSMRVAGSGVAAVVAQAKTATGIGGIEFAPYGTRTFSALPSTGVENSVRIRTNGQLSELRASIVTGEFVQIATLPLAPGDAEGSYVSRFTPGVDGFRVLISARDANGFAVQRIHAPLFTPMR